MIKNRKTLLAASMALVAIGCSQKDMAADSDQNLGPGSVATVNGQRIPESLFRLYTLAVLKKDPDKLQPDERKSIIDDLVGLKLLEVQAEQGKVPEERTVAAQLELQRMQFLARTMVGRYLTEHPVTDEELKKVYDDNLPQLSATQYKARHILVSTSEAAEKVIQQLKKGKDFAELAKEQSTDPTGPNGGDLGWFTSQSMIKPVMDALEKMKVGTFSTVPVKSNFGYHVLLLEDTRTQEAPPMDKIRNQLQSAVDNRKAQELMDSLRKSANVTYEEVTK